MGTKPKKSANLSATELCCSSTSRLILKFINKNNPELDRAEFRCSKSSKVSYLQRGDPDKDKRFAWSEVLQSLSLCMLDYRIAALKKPSELFFFSGSRTASLAATLGEAISGHHSRLESFFIEHDSTGAEWLRLDHVFVGDNVHGRLDRDRRITIKSDYLPPTAVEIFWDARVTQPLTKLIDLETLAARIRRSLGLEPNAGPEIELIEESSPPPTAPSQPPQPPPVTPPPVQQLSLPQSFLTSIERLATAATRPPPEPTKPQEAPRPKIIELPKVQPKALAPINPQLFKIQNPEGRVWEDSMGLLDFGEDGGNEGADYWRLKDAYEGVLILGAPGSGKTSGSGFAFAQAFLQAGMGGLVLVAKTDEARRWESLCSRFGRAQDCITITRESSYHLNALEYESQRPGTRVGLTDDLIAFFRILISIVSKQLSEHGGDRFWINATNQLMRALFDTFLLAREPLSIESLTHFVSKAPERPIQLWQDIEFFGPILNRAQQNITTEEDHRVYNNCLEYWTVIYPGIAEQTRSGITLGFTAMVDALSGRGIHDLIASDTNITPESILSGKIIILDVPIKDCGQGGLLVQAAWKYLFQRAVERRADKGRQTARPVFLWEDEGHLFFSQHDVSFQPTARDCRAAHVILSQSLHNFYQLGHNPHAVQSVFATMNTQVFHANGDLDTNKWASEKLGTETVWKTNVSVAPETQHGFWEFFKPHESKTTTSINENREPMFRPEGFTFLKKGGDGTCQAVLLWVSHSFSCNSNRPFRLTLFAQDNEL